jgi:hypothetical protein
MSRDPQTDWLEAQLRSAEAHVAALLDQAWDKYFVAAITSGHPPHRAAEIADAALAIRKERTRQK